MKTFTFIAVCIGIFIITIILKRSKNIRVSMSALFTIRLIRIGAVIAPIIYALTLIPGFDKSWRAIVTGSGIAAVVLGLAAQSTLANIFAGVSISSVNRPFEIGDRVKIGDVEPGFVKNITLRHVELMTYMGQTVLIPNSIVQSAVIINYTKEDGNAYPIEITVGYDCDLTRAIQIFEDVVNTYPLHYGRLCTVLVKEAGDYGIKLKGMVETKDFMDTTVACSDCLKEILKKYKAEGIDVPYPTVEVKKH